VPAMIGRLCGVLIVGIAALEVGAPVARAERPPEPKGEASLIVTGMVRGVYQEVQPQEIHYVVEITTEQAAAGTTPRDPGPVAVPEPGAPVYVHVFQRRADAPRVPAAYGHKAIPRVGTRLRAYLYPSGGDVGRWEGAYPDWFDALNSGPIPPGPGPGPQPRMIGVFTQPVQVGNRMGLQITGVAPGGPAARIGLEPGDIILEADGRPTTTPAQLSAAVRDAGDILRLLIRNVRNGQIQRADVVLDGPS
jgi:membrane-associated protease RseP (regulator of RpoE activity)